MKRTITTLFLVSLVILAGACTHKSAVDPIVFVGVWSVDLERSIEEMKKSPKNTPEELESLRRIFGGAIKTMQIRFTPTEMSYEIGKEKNIYPYTVLESKKISARLAVRLQEKDHTVTLQLVDGAFMNLKSSASSDMDYYMWKKVSP